MNVKRDTKKLRWKTASPFRRWARFGLRLFRRLFLRNRKQLFASVGTITLLVLFLFSAAPHPAYAGCGGWIATAATLGLNKAACAVKGAVASVGETILDAFFHAIEWVLGAIANLFWKLSLIAANFLSWVLLDLNSAVGFYTNTFVLAGWTVTRDIANWFFIVLLLIGAISTILNIERYNVNRNRKFLRDLIVVALLINFSLYFLAFAINVVQSFMLLFVKNGLQPYGNVGAVLHNALKLGDSHDGLANVEDAIRKAQGDIGEEFSIMMLRILMILFAAGAAFIFFYMAIMFIIRIIFLWISLILSPLALLARIAPGTSKFYSEWSNIFFSNLFFGVIGVFFIWLATWLADYLSLPTATWNTQDLVTSASPGLPGIVTSASFLMQYITVFAFLWLSMVYAKKFAGDTAKATTQALAVGGVATGATLATIGRLRETRALQRAQGAVAAPVGRAISGARLPIPKTIPVIGAKIPIIGGKAIYVPGARGAGRALMGAGEGSRRLADQEAEKIMRLGNRDNITAAYRNAKADVQAALGPKLRERKIFDYVAGGGMGEKEVIAVDSKGVADKIKVLQAKDPERKTQALRLEAKYRPEDSELRSRYFYLNDSADERKRFRARATDDMVKEGAHDIMVNMLEKKDFGSEFISDVSQSHFAAFAQGLSRNTQLFKAMEQELLKMKATVHDNAQLMGVFKGPMRRLFSDDVLKEFSPPGLAGGRAPEGPGKPMQSSGHE